MKKFFLIFIIFYFISLQSSATDEKKFLSTKFNEVNLRKGPGLQHFIIAKFLKKGLPVEIIGGFDNWAKIRFFNQKIGWVSKTQLTNKRFGIMIAEETNLYYFPNKNAKKKAIIKKDFIFFIKSCQKEWCKIKANEKVGWIAKKTIWGVNAKEEF